MTLPPEKLVDLDVVEFLLGELADEAFQRRYWTAKDPSLGIFEFGETCCQLYDDQGLGFLLGTGRGNLLFGPQATVLLQQLNSALDAVDARQTVDDLIASDAMIPVRRLSGEALLALRHWRSQRS